jgi:hypothetical protein
MTVMPQIPQTDTVHAIRSMDEEFLELLCADEELLRAEFDAIIAAEWPGPPPAEPNDGADAARRPRRARRSRQASAAGLPNQPRHPGMDGWSRQRSPPDGGSRLQEGR